ncbi:DinB family protein, partial [Modestobacter versicolor]
MAEFADADLRGSRFSRVDLSGSRFAEVVLTGAVLRGVELVDVEIDGYLQHLVVNGVDVVPLVEAELDRRDPDRALLRPTDPAGFRAAWDVVERRWAATVERARRLDPAQLHESVDGEWSFVETLRHLVYATDAWVRRA